MIIVQLITKAVVYLNFYVHPQYQILDHISVKDMGRVLLMVLLEEQNMHLNEL